MLSAVGLDKHFNGIRALVDFSCTIKQGEILGLIGPNGAGKTTFFNVLSGFIPPDAGKVIFKNVDLTAASAHQMANLGLSRTFQNLRLIRQITVLENILVSFRSQPGEKLTNIFFRWEKSQSQEIVNRKEAFDLLEKAGLAHKADDQAEALSYGQQKLLSLLCCLAAKSDLLLLDEPVAGIAPELIDRILGIIRELPASGKSVILIEHNLDAITQICDRVIFMDSGAKVSEGTPEEIRNDPRVIEAYIG